MVFRAWRAVAVDARKTREYFERLERGELDDDMDMESGVSTENYRFAISYFWISIFLLHVTISFNFRDDLALLPRKCAIQIFGNLDLMDLGRCARVSRAWKIITGAPSLWSNLNFNKVRSR